MLLSLLPHKSWNAIKKEAQSLGLHRRSQPSLDIDDYTTWSDWQFCMERGIEPTERNTIRVPLSCQLVTVSDLPEGKKGEIQNSVDCQHG